MELEDLTEASEESDDGRESLEDSYLLSCMHLQEMVDMMKKVKGQLKSVGKDPRSRLIYKDATSLIADVELFIESTE